MTITTLSRQNVRSLNTVPIRPQAGSGTVGWMRWISLHKAFQLSGKDLNRYPEPQPQAVVQGVCQLCGRTAWKCVGDPWRWWRAELVIRAFCRTKIKMPFVLTYATYNVMLSAETAGVACKTVPLTAISSDLPELNSNWRAWRSLCVAQTNTTGNLWNGQLLELQLATAKPWWWMKPTSEFALKRHRKELKITTLAIVIAQTFAGGCIAVLY